MLEKLARVISIVGGIASVVALIYIFRQKVSKSLRRLASLLRAQWIGFLLACVFLFVWVLEPKVGLLGGRWSVGLLFVSLAVIVWIVDLRVRHLKKTTNKLLTLVSFTFEDDFKTDLKTKWEYQGDWSILPGGGLSVTNSEVGGMTKVGHGWTDYSFEFTATIVRKCIGWIVRAQEHSSYYMIQLNETVVRPHLRFGTVWIAAPQGMHGEAIDGKAHHLDIRLNKPLMIRTEARGLGIRIHVNDQQIYDDPDFFAMRFINEQHVLVDFVRGVFTVPPFTAGRVGFRLAGNEHGKFFQCRVRPLTIVV